MSDQLKGTVALVTGASSGIGEATAEARAGRRGAAVAIAARRKDRLEALAERIGAKADEAKALVLEADVTDEQQAKLRSIAPWASSGVSTSWSTTPG